jgi:hypothetical protein
MKTIILQHFLSAVFPGCGHFFLDRPLRAAAYALLFYCCLEGSLLAILIDDPTVSRLAMHACMGTLILIWVAAHVDLLRIRGRLASVTEEMFVEGISDYLRGNLDESESKMRRLISADPYDVDARMYLSLILQDRGDLKAARRQLRKCRRMDLEGTLDWETETELERLRDLETSAD